MAGDFGLKIPQSQIIQAIIVNPQLSSLHRLVVRDFLCTLLAQVVERDFLDVVLAEAALARDAEVWQLTGNG